jgi:spore coat protein U-like protein
MGAKMNKMIVAGFGLAVSAILASAPAAAATSTTTMSVTATVQATCSVSATTLAFGTYTGVQLDGSSTLTVNCTNTTPYTLALNVGTGTGATVATRKMTAAAQTLNYSLYQDSGRATVWGQTTGTDTVAGTGNGGAQPLTVYGRIPGGQLPTPGSYADTITATITY